MENDVEQVLGNWIEIAMSPRGQLPEGITPSRWVTEKFIRWWRGQFEDQVDESLGDADMALRRIRELLGHQGGWEKFGEALHECAHLAEALQSLRQLLLPEKK